MSKSCTIKCIKKILAKHGGMSSAVAKVKEFIVAHSQNLPSTSCSRGFKLANALVNSFEWEIK